MRPKWITAAIALVAMPLAAITPSAGAAAAPARGATQATPVVVSTAPSHLGRVLVTGAGQSLYVFTGDGFPFSATGLQLNCTALNTAPNGLPCTTAWPPLLATGPLVAKNGVHQAGLGTVTRNGLTQVTYFGKPLYRFIQDTAPGQMNGEDVAAFKGMWYLDARSGRPAVIVPTVQTEVSRVGIVLSTPTAFSTFRSLYLLSFDTQHMSTCTGVCAAIWPPLLTSRTAHAGVGVSRDGFGTLRRPDGTHQVTFKGHPLYFFAFDLDAFAPSGLTNGEYLIDTPANGVWYTVLPQGTPNPGTTTVRSESSSGRQILSITGGFNATTATLYAFSADSATASHCTGTCAKFWPPVLTTTPPQAMGGANASLLGTIPRPDGTFQVTYNGHPLYFFAPDLSSGTGGAGVTAFGGTFNVVNVTGAVG